MGRFAVQMLISLFFLIKIHHVRCSPWASVLAALLHMSFTAGDVLDSDLTYPH